MKYFAYRQIFFLMNVMVSPLLVNGCASTQFDQALDAHRWSDAAHHFDADTTLQNDEHALFRAAMLHSFPNRDTYDPVRARELFNKLLEQYPATATRQVAVDHLALLDEVQRVQTNAEAQTRADQAQIAQLSADTVQLHRQLDSLSVRLQTEQDQSALLHKMTTLLENDLRARENQLRDLDAELAQLKAIDLKPPIRPKVADTTHRVEKE